MFFQTCCRYSTWLPTVHPGQHTDIYQLAHMYVNIFPLALLQCLRPPAQVRCRGVGEFCASDCFRSCRYPLCSPSPKVLLWICYESLWDNFSQRWESRIAFFKGCFYFSILLQVCIFCLHQYIFCLLKLRRYLVLLCWISNRQPFQSSLVCLLYSWEGGLALCNGLIIMSMWIH